MALNLKKNEPATTPVDEAVKDQAAAAVAAPETTAPAVELGTKSDKIVLIAPLGDPSREDVTPRTVNGVEEKVVTSTIVGYLFKALEDVDVPECGLGDDARKNPMSYKEIGPMKHVKAGETFALTRFETGVLLSQPQYNARINGDGKEFTVVYQKSANAPKGADGSAAKVDAGRLPTVSLRGIELSIKDLKMVDVLTFRREQTTDSNGKPRNQIVDRKVVAGYEKWEPLCRAAVRKPAQPGVSTDRTSYNKSAQAFLSMVAKKRG